MAAISPTVQAALNLANNDHFCLSPIGKDYLKGALCVAH